MDGARRRGSNFESNGLTAAEWQRTRHEINTMTFNHLFQCSKIQRAVPQIANRREENISLIRETEFIEYPIYSHDSAFRIPAILTRPN